jgi:hypothetical protein
MEGARHCGFLRNDPSMGTPRSARTMPDNLVGSIHESLRNRGAFALRRENGFFYSDVALIGLHMEFHKSIK